MGCGGFVRLPFFQVVCCFVCFVVVVEVGAGVDGGSGLLAGF